MYDGVLQNGEDDTEFLEKDRERMMGRGLGKLVGGYVRMMEGEGAGDEGVKCEEIRNVVRSVMSEGEMRTVKERLKSEMEIAEGPAQRMGRGLMDVFRGIGRFMWVNQFT